MLVGELYHLRFTYPIIDGVAYLKNKEGALSLLFLQTSISDHETKLHHVTTVSATEDDKTILEHYKVCLIKCNKFDVHYVYVSPHNVSKSIKIKHNLRNIQFAEIVYKQ